MESDVGICKEGECLTGEAVSVLFDFSLGHYGEFLPGDRTRCRDTKHSISKVHVSQQQRLHTKLSARLNMA